MKFVGLSLCSLHSRANPSVLTSIKAGISLEVGARVVRIRRSLEVFIRHHRKIKLMLTGKCIFKKFGRGRLPSSRMGEYNISAVKLVLRGPGWGIRPM